MAMLIITHDLGVIAEIADDVVVMYAGKIVESAPVAALFADPQHPYTIGLLGSIPRLDVERERLATIEGTVPGADHQPKGCRFSPRCPFADRRCRDRAAAAARDRRRATGRLLEGAGRAGGGMSETPGPAGRRPGEAFPDHAAASSAASWSGWCAPSRT